MHLHLTPEEESNLIFGLSGGSSMKHNFNEISPA